MLPPLLRGERVVDEDAVHLESMIDAGFRYLVFLMADGLMGARAMTHRLLSDVLPRLRPSATS